MRKIIFLILPLILIFSIFIVPPSAHAQQYTWSGVCVAGPDNDVATIQGFQCLIANVFSIIITVIGLAGFVMFIWGAFQWMLSGNNTKGVETAKQSMTYAIIGIVVALSGFIIINLIAEFTGVNIIRTFIIPSSETDEQGNDPVVVDQNTV
ncbi:MAG: hypothetical protein COY81_01615 [Candidatus Pacebacteria bacterium CG_4_10_14_0_8_um_filter_43_12]|nr:MAG: hypothetical protein COY81_01615 [Candidatus Pacebacteria bacterium CG_4_10_14_0_8_um_filter_43_12]